jgi:DNA-binding transcriptional MerR regulator
VRVSELSRVTGVPVATIKYYLREGLLPRGRSTGRNQAVYADEHIRRLRLIRTLREIGRLGIEDVRAVLGAIADEELPLHDLLGVAHRALGPRPDPSPVTADVEAARADVDRFLDELGWQVGSGAPARRTLADALVALRRLGRDCGPEVFGFHAEAAERIAAYELERTSADDGRAAAVEGAVTGIVVFESALAALRRLAQEHHSRLRFGRRGSSRAPAEGSRPAH